MAGPHVLGGSNNLRSERARRERAEAALQQSRERLRVTTQELAPQLQRLAQSVQMLQEERRQQLQLDEASQELLETLQQQLDELERRQQHGDEVDCRVENALRSEEQRAEAEGFELRTLLSKLQELQDEHATELRMLQQELVASKEFMGKRLSALEDAVDSVRAEVVRASELQHGTLQTHASKIDDLDEKLFAIDKELLKLKLALPPTVKAQIPTAFTDQQGASMDGNRISTQQGGGLDITLQVQGLKTDLEALKTDALAYRAADRKQFDALTNRMREAAKSHQTLKKEVEGRLEDIRARCDQMIVKVPSELSKRVQRAQSAWSDEIASLKSSVLSLEAFYNIQKRKGQDNQTSAATAEQLKLSDDVNVLRQEVSSLRDEHESRLTRIDGDLLGLYDWTRDKVESIRYATTT